MKKEFHIENKAGKAHIQIIGEISWWKNRSEDFIKMINELIEEGVQDLHLYINSPGGSMDHANEIVNQLHRFEGNKSLTLGAMACSAAFTIMLSFDKDKTSCYKNTMGMYHDPSGFVMVRKMSDFDATKKLFEDLRNDVVERIAQRTELDKEEVSKRMEKTTWLNSKELKDQGFVGTILDAKDKVPTGAKNALKNMGFELPSFVNEAEESDLLHVFNTPEDTTKHSINNETEMKELAKKLGLPENATTEQIIAAIETLQNKASFGEEALINLAVSKGIKKENAEKSVKNNFDGTLDLVNGLQAPAPKEEGKEETTETPANAANSARPSDLLQALKNELGLSNQGGGAIKKLEDYTTEELDELERKEPAKFEQLWKDSKFGKVKNPQD